MESNDGEWSLKKHAASARRQASTVNEVMAGDKKRKSRTPAVVSTPAGKKPKAPATSYPSWDDHQGFTVARLLDGQSLLFMGQAVLTVLQGSVDVDGHAVSVGATPLPLSTAGRNASPAIRLTARAISSQVPLAGSEVVEVTLQSPPAQPPTPSLSAPVMLEAGAATGHQAGEAAPSFTLHVTGVGHMNTGGSTGGASGSAPASGSALPRQMLVPQDWQAAMREVVDVSLAAVGDTSRNNPSGAHGPPPPPTVVVAGPKGAGKSSLARLLVNQLLNHHPVVAYLDTDCGQPELTTPGSVSITLLSQSLLGPSCTHLRPAHFSHYMGDLSPDADPALYTAAIASLYSWYCSPACKAGAAALTGLARSSGHTAEQAGQASGSGAATASASPAKGTAKSSKRGAGGKNTEAAEPAAASAVACPWPPLVVNMHGWVTGLGCDLTSEVMRIIGPTHMLQMRVSQERKNLPPGPFWWDAAYEQRPCPTRILTLSSPAPHHHRSHHHGNAAVHQTAVGMGAGKGQAGGRGGEDEDEEGGLGIGEEGGDEDGAGMSSTAGAGKGSGWLSAADNRTLQWLAWAKAATGQDPAWGSYDAGDLFSAACALAAVPPLAISLDDIRVTFMHTAAPTPAELGRSLNGVVVGLLVDAQPVAGGWEVTHASPPECVGVGLVRAVDMATRTLYLLTPTPVTTMERVTTLAVGRAAGDQLPHGLLHAGAAGLGCPYRALFCLPLVGSAGAGVMKGGRRNLTRTGTVATL